MARPSRCLEYAGVDGAWEARELRAFSGRGAAIRSAHAVANFLLGRLLEEDLHVSCKPMLPANVQEMNGTMLQGVCLLQVVDIVNIGANFEHRTEDSKGPTRTLKLCLTDGHQTVFGFEYKWIPALNVKTARGTKVIVQNVAIRHGMMMLTPDTCQVLGASGNDALDVAKVQLSGSAGVAEVPSGAYAAALMTAGATLTTQKSTDDQAPVVAPRVASERSQQPTRVSPNVPNTALPPRGSSLPQTAADLIGGRFSAPLPASPPPARPRNPPARPAVFSPPRAKAEVVTPAVFVDISSEDDDMASDVTDPMVEHLFYSPNTPRLNEVDRSRAVSRKRPHPNSSRARASTPPSDSMEVVDMTASPPTSAYKPEEPEPSFSLLPTPQPTAPPPRVNPRAPFVYFSSRTSSLTDSQINAGSILTIRGFMKSVTGFQFHTGVYNLRVLIEDGTATREVQVDPALVQSLMGVPCAKFQEAMQSTPAVAHRLAAKMQVTLMTMQGIMRLRLDATAPEKWTLLQCRAYSAGEATALLARVRHFAQASNHLR